MFRCLTFSLLCLLAANASLQAQVVPPSNYPAKLVEPLPFGEEFVEVTVDGTLRRRYRVWGDFEAEMAAWKGTALKASAQRTSSPRTFRLGCVFLKDAIIECPDVIGADGQPLRAAFSTPPEFEKEMREKTTQAYGDFTTAFTGGQVQCEWLFETLDGLKWTSTGKQPGWGCQPRAIGEQLGKALAKHEHSKVDMWVWCAGSPKVLNGNGKQKVPGPPYGISYTQWQLFGGYSIACCAPHLPLLVHEVNHRYLDNLAEIEGVQLTLFHGLNALGYAGGDIGYPDQLAVYRSVYLHLIRPAMWGRFSLTGPPTAKPEAFSGKLYRWQDVADDCWFRLPLLGKRELARLTGLPSLEFVADRQTTWRHFTVSEADRALLRSPYTATASDNDTAINNLLSLSTESCAVLHTPTGHWLVVRPEVAEVYVQAADKDAQLEVAGWLNEGVRPLLLFRARPELAVPAKEIDYFR